MDESVARKVRKLLKLGESDNPNESAAAVAMAAALMERHRITADMLSLESLEADPVEPVRNWEDPLTPDSSARRPRWQGSLAVRLSKPNGCEVYQSGGVLRIIGTASNVERVRYLFAHCRREVERLAARHGRGNGRTWGNNFRLGCVDAVGKAIAAERAKLHREMRVEYQGSSALVPLETALARVDRDYADARQFGRVKVGLRAGSASSHRSDPGARAAGRNAGAGIYSSGGPGLGSGRRQIGG